MYDSPRSMLVPAGDVLQHPVAHHLFVLISSSYVKIEVFKFVSILHIYSNKQTPWPLVRERTIPTDRQPLLDEI
jgi:hypothetical protein